MTLERKAGGAGAAALTVALAQGNFQVGNLAANQGRIAAFHGVANRLGADLLVLPELALSGYPPQDLLFDREFLARHDAALAHCAALTENGCALLMGGVRREGAVLHNAAFLFHAGRQLAVQDKRSLPNHGVFDERRYFSEGTTSEVMRLHGIGLGVLICEDAWVPHMARELAAGGADLLLCLNASPFETDKQSRREWIGKMRVHECALPLVYVNTVAAQDDLIFDGCSFVMDAQGQVTSRLAPFKEDFQLARFSFDGSKRGRLVPGPTAALAAPQRQDELAYSALVFALREFANRNGYQGAVLGLSGGMDSALCAAIAVDAFGADKVQALFLPSPFTSGASREDALACARRLGINCEEVPIEAGMQAFTSMAGAVPAALAGENQTRIRASLLLARARHRCRLLINTGNKSEIATGYTTMYGDLCGHYGPLKDVYKTMVYRLAAWRNTRGEPIPQRVFHKPPSAELHAGQRDDETLPPYPLLDAILEHLLEHELTADEIVARGHDRTMVRAVQNMLDAAQHKRHQAPPGPKITRKALANDRRYPITNGWYAQRLAAGKLAEEGSAGITEYENEPQ